ncbi:MAG TPA: ornithine carbamoyltransferase [Ktedonobacterales bacterium]
MYHLLSLDDVIAADMQDMFTQARLLKLGRASGAPPAQPLAGHTIALLFEKPSLRTRVSFEVAARELGASSLYLSWQEVGLGKREAARDVARVLSSYVHAIVMRTFSQALVEEMARWSSVPVINGLTDIHHPCQGLTDVFTIEEQLGGAQGKTLAYIGDGNNCALSLAQAAAKAGMRVRIATPAGYTPNPAALASAQRDAAQTGGDIALVCDPFEAAAGADAIYTDVWASMGQEDEAEARKLIFAGYQVNSALLAVAAQHAIVLHPLPAHRGEEITDDVLDSAHSRVFAQAENRLHVQKAILRMAMIGHGAERRETALTA